MNRIYLDNAATTWPKPPEVYEAMDYYHRSLGAPAGRSSYAEAAEVDRILAQCRRQLATLLGAEESRRIVFTASGTDSLNLAILGIVRPGDHVITTELEHNSVLRPLRHLEQTQQVSVTRVPIDLATSQVSPEAVQESLRPETRLIVVNHASNVTGAVQPVAEIAEIARLHGALLLVDAAQTAGHLPIDVQQLGADLLAAPGHKGLLGPLGTGLLYLRPGIEEELEPWRKGGTGTESSSDQQPSQLPHKLESGSLNVPGIFGLEAASRYLLRQGIDTIFQHGQQLRQQLIAGLKTLNGVTVLGADANQTPYCGVVSLLVQGYDSREAAAILESSFRIQTRAGFHCAPEIHRRYQTEPHGGALRLSIGPMNTVADIEQALAAIGELAAG